MAKDAQLSIRVTNAMHHKLAVAAQSEDAVLSQWIRDALELVAKRPLNEWTALDVVAGNRPERRVS